MLGQSITFTLSFFSKAVVVILLEYCPAAQSPKGGDHALLQYVRVHVGIHGSLNEHSFPVTAALLQPQTMTFPPPCLTVGKTHLSLYSSPGCRHTLDTIWTKYVYLHQNTGHGSSNEWIHFLFVTYTIILRMQRPGSSWGFGALLKGLTSVVDNSCRSRDSNTQPQVTSPTLYPLGLLCLCP